MDQVVVVFGAPLGFEYLWAAVIAVLTSAAIPFAIAWTAGPALIGRKTLSMPARLGLAAAIPLLAVALLAWNFYALPTGYSLSSKTVEIHRRWRPQTVRLADITSVAFDSTGNYRSVYCPGYSQLFSPPRSQGRRFLYRVIPIGIQHLSLAVRDRLGVMYVETYVTDSTRVVVLRGKHYWPWPVALSPDEPERFITEVKKRLVALQKSAAR